MVEFNVETLYPGLTQSRACSGDALATPNGESFLTLMDVDLIVKRENTVALSHSASGFITPQQVEVERLEVEEKPGQRPVPT